MNLPLPLHLAIHLILALVAGYLVGRAYQKIPLGLLAGILGGFFIDLDHVLEYFLVYGPHFNLTYFLEGRQFLISDQIHIWFHAWEYVPILILAAWLFRRKTAVVVFILAVAMGGMVHLATDCAVNEFPPQDYSLVDRWQHNFSAPALLRPDQYQKYIDKRLDYNI